MSSFINKLNAKGCNFTKVSKMPVKNAKNAETVQSAIKKIVAKLKANKDYVVGVSSEKVDANYKLVGGKYTFGIKYGNRYLKNALDAANEMTFIELDTKQELLDAFDFAVELVQSGECNDSILQAIAANVSMHSKRKA